MANNGNISWESLERLRAAYLDGTAGENDYWHSADDLAWYDRTFARRIGWKWEYVLRELERFGWIPPVGTLTDWGCGSGIAGRTVLEHFGFQSFTELLLYDRSDEAMRFAAVKALEYYPQLSVQPLLTEGITGGTALISHVITELTPAQVRILAETLRNAEAVVWVEPGTYAASRALIAAREMLRNDFHIVAPCLHAGSCGMLSPTNKRHWCHFFAESPPEAYTEREWAQFAAKTGIDLSDLPLSYLVLDKRPPQFFPADAVRIIARPHVTKFDAAVVGCTAAGVTERLLQKKRLPDQWRSFKKDDFDSLQQWKIQDREIVEMSSK